jgi:uncharacterized damage-inducible protein DinB
MTRIQSEQLSGLISAANAIADQTRAGFGDLTSQQLNWKPGSDQWSVAQCFDHLVTANEAYFPTFEKVLSGEKKNTFWESLPWVPAFWGKMLIKSLDPDMKATENLDVEKIKISSPVTNLITYSLMDAYRIIITHEKRHILQASRVTEMDGFPKAVS